MKKVRDRFIKNLHYFFLIGVVALGLMTIVGSGGGGDGGGGGTTTTTTPKSYKLTPEGFLVSCVKIYHHGLSWKHKLCPGR